MMEPTEFVPKRHLEDGAYYVGRCRNANIARWSAAKNKFVHWRTKFGSTFLEEISHPDDEKHYDVFYPLFRSAEPRPIPLGEENAPVRTVSQNPAS
jgi:hypothetical protein